MASILCPKCRNPLEIPKPAPEKIFCLKCGASFRNQSYKPSDNGAGQASGVASPQVAQKLAAGAAGAGAAHAVAEPRVARNLAGGPESSPPPSTPNPNKAALIMGAGGAAAVVLLSVIVWQMMKQTEPPKKSDETPVAAKKEKEKEHKNKDKGKDKDKDNTPGITIPGSNPGATIEVDPTLQKSLDRGVAYLRTQIPGSETAVDNANGGGNRGGSYSLIGLAMLECKVPVDDPDLITVANKVRAMAPHMNNPYDIAPAIFFLDRLSSSPSEDDLKLIKSLGLRLVAAQHRPVNLWRYSAPILGKREKDVLDQVNDGTYKGPLVTDLVNGQDMSCSQFAALGLWTARRHGVPVDEALKNAALSARSFQDVDDEKHKGTWTWNYGAQDQGGQFRDTSTCCGLILLSLGEAVEDRGPGKRKDFLKDVRFVNALKHLEGVIKRNGPDAKKPKKKALNVQAHGEFYFLWALERTALILDLERIGDEVNDKGEPGQDWHDWGTKFVLEHQQDDGSWNSKVYPANGAVPDTCFALLFLKRANLFKDLTDKLNGLVSPTSAGIGPGPPQPAPGRPRNG